MRLTITEELYNIICDILNDKMEKLKQERENEKGDNRKKILGCHIELIQKKLGDLKPKGVGKVDFVDKVIKHAKVLYRDDKIKFDTKNLLGFDNCVYDPETDEFREYRYDDYICITNGL